MASGTILMAALSKFFLANNTDLSGMFTILFVTAKKQIQNFD